MTHNKSNFLPFRFLHSMKTREHLESALRSGMMLTDHEVSFVISSKAEDRKLYFDSMMLLIENHLKKIGANSFDTLSEESKRNIIAGINGIRADIPMLCFTEVLEGRDLSQQYRNFGYYGIVVTQEWLQENGGDRVIYVGGNSPVTQSLFQIFAHLHISNMIKEPDGKIIFQIGRASCRERVCSTV